MIILAVYFLRWRLYGMVDEIEFIQNMQKLEIKDGDIVVLKTKHIYTNKPIKISRLQ